MTEATETVNKSSNSYQRMSSEEDESSSKMRNVTPSSSSSIGSFTSLQIVTILSLVALIVRNIFLEHPSVVIFDEVHFGGFASKYLKGEFFFDVHPPLARLLVTLSAWVGGFTGNFSFYTIGADYIKAGVPYVTMRSFTATLGAALVPIAYITCLASGLSLPPGSPLARLKAMRALAVRALEVRAPAMRALLCLRRLCLWGRAGRCANRARHGAPQ